MGTKENQNKYIHYRRNGKGKPLSIGMISGLKINTKGSKGTMGTKKN
jgi:hypothetical protein